MFGKEGGCAKIVQCRSSARVVVERGPKSEPSWIRRRQFCAASMESDLSKLAVRSRFSRTQWVVLQAVFGVEVLPVVSTQRADSRAPALLELEISRRFSSPSSHSLRRLLKLSNLLCSVYNRLFSFTPTPRTNPHLPGFATLSSNVLRGPGASPTHEGWTTQRRVDRSGCCWRGLHSQGT